MSWCIIIYCSGWLNSCMIVWYWSWISNRLFWVFVRVVLQSLNLNQIKLSKLKLKIITRQKYRDRKIFHRISRLKRIKPQKRRRKIRLLLQMTPRPYNFLKMIGSKLLSQLSRHKHLFRKYLLKRQTKLCLLNQIH